MYGKRITRTPFWVLERKEFNLEDISLNETLFSIGNGYIGARGVLSEGPGTSYAGTYISGIYDSTDNEPAEIVNCPNPFRIELDLDGKRFNMEEAKIHEHVLKLDIKKALFLRSTVFEVDEKIYRYETRRFFSLSDVHSGMMSFSISCLNSNSDIKICHLIDGRTENKLRIEKEAIRRYTIAEISGKNGTIYLESETKDRIHHIGMALYSECESDKSLQAVNVDQENNYGVEYNFRAEKRKTYSFNSFLSFYTSREEKQVKKSCLATVKSNSEAGINAILNRHTQKWESLWKDSDIQITGNQDYQLSVRFNAYHLLIASPVEDLDTNIPAKTLTGEWYKGHIFWDTEIYAFPFFNFTQPEIAKNLLMYRARRLEAARKNAQFQNYKGALWPWESAESGRDETPDTWRDFDGRVIPVYNKYREHHIAADVIYAVLQYYYTRGDEEFMLDNGLEMILSTSRFIASRVDYNDEKKKYEFKTVIGPNEFQEDVDNNSYTNYMSAAVLKSGVEIFRKFSKRYPRKTALLADKLKLQPEEISQWEVVSKELLFLQDDKGVIEEFEGYFRKKDIVIKNHNENGMPVWPAEVKQKDVKNTQLIKQADAVLLLYLFSSEFSNEVKKVNYDYYIQRTTHLSSLSLPIYMMVALDIGLHENYEQFFEQVFNCDLKNIYKNTDHGIHAASLGGAWQVIANGFAGISIKDQVLHIKPQLPDTWEGLKFRIWFQQALFELNLTHDETEITLVRDRKRKEREFTMKVNDKTITLSKNSNKIVV